MDSPRRTIITGLVGLAMGFVLAAGALHLGGGSALDEESMDYTGEAISEPVNASKFSTTPYGVRPGQEAVTYRFTLGGNEGDIQIFSFKPVASGDAKPGTLLVSVALKDSGLSLDDALDDGANTPPEDDTLALEAGKGTYRVTAKYADDGGGWAVDLEKITDATPNGDAS